MWITEVESFPIELPPELPVSRSDRTLASRDRAMTCVRMDAGRGVPLDRGRARAVRRRLTTDTKSRYS